MSPWDAAEGGMTATGIGRIEELLSWAALFFDLCELVVIGVEHYLTLFCLILMQDSRLVKKNERHRIFNPAMV